MDKIITGVRKLILVSISSTEERFVIRLKHKIDYVVEKKFRKTNTSNKRTIYVLIQVIVSVLKLIFKEAFVRIRS